MLQWLAWSLSHIPTTSQLPNIIHFLWSHESLLVFMKRAAERKRLHRHLVKHWGYKYKWGEKVVQILYLFLHFFFYNVLFHSSFSLGWHSHNSHLVCIRLLRPGLIFKKCRHELTVLYSFYYLISYLQSDPVEFNPFHFAPVFSGLIYWQGKLAFLGWSLILLVKHLCDPVIFFHLFLFIYPNRALVHL